MLQVAVGDFVSRVGYPCTRGGFARTFEHILPCAFYRVVAVDERREAITVSVLVGKDYAEEEFWAGNFRVVTHRDCIAPLDTGSRRRTMATSDESDYVVESAPEDLKFLYAWSLEARKGVLDTTNDRLKQIMTLSAALCGGGFLLTGDSVQPVFRILAVVAFLAAFLFSFIGNLPYRFEAPPDVPELFWQGIVSSLEQKTKMLKWSAGFIIIGFVLAIVGVLFR